MTAPFTVKDRILLLLYSRRNFYNDFDRPDDMCQDGMARVLGISRQHAAVELRKLADQGMIEGHLTHIKNRRTRKITYTLLPIGFNEAQTMTAIIKGQGNTIQRVIMGATA